MLSLIVITFQCFNNGFQVSLIAQEIGIGGIYKQSFYIMVFDIICIGFLYVEEILVRYLLFIRPVTFFDIGLQFTNRSMQLNNKVGLYQLLMDNIKQPLVKTKLIFR